MLSINSDNQYKPITFTQPITQKGMVEKRKDYNKKYNEAVEFFRQRVNKDQRQAKLPEYGFMPIRMRLIALKEIDDMRVFYKECIEYSYTKDKLGKRNTFSKKFWGATKVQ